MLRPIREGDLTRHLRLIVVLGAVFAMCLLAVVTRPLIAATFEAHAVEAPSDVSAPATLAPATLAPAPAAVTNGLFECSQFVEDGRGGRIPAGWILVRADGEPVINSARHHYAGSCAGSSHVERIEGDDAITIRARDIETPPLPGKPFDVVFYQQVAVASGGDYSVSGWLLSLCGGSAVPNDCPEGVYIRKAIGLDPTGGIDPDSPNIVWIENLDNFITREQVRVGWSNLRVGARAQSSVMTVFLRVHSPFQWHGAHAFVDAIHLARAPVAWFVDLPRTMQAGVPSPLRWSSFESPEIAAIPGGTHETLIDIQARVRSDDGDFGPWQDLIDGGPPEGQCAFVAERAGATVQLRLRARAEQPPPPAPGAWPNQRFPGPWSEPRTVQVRAATSSNMSPLPDLTEHALYVPVLSRVSSTVQLACGQ